MVAVPKNEPIIWNNIYGPTLDQGKRDIDANAIETAGFIWPPFQYLNWTDLSKYYFFFNEIPDIAIDTEIPTKAAKPQQYERPNESIVLSLLLRFRTNVAVEEQPIN